MFGSILNNMSSATNMGTGAVMGIAGSLLKKKPKIPTFKKVDQAKAQQEGIAANLASFSQANQLANQTTGADQDRLDSMLSRVEPNYRKNLAAASASIGDMLNGRLGIGDQSYAMRQSAERGGALGLAGSGAGRNLTARDLGLTEFQVRQQGLNAFNQFSSNLRQNYTVNPMSTAFSYTSPQQYVQNAMQQNQFGYNAAVGKAQSDAANHWRSRLGNGLSAVGGAFMGAGIAGSGGGGNVGSTMGNTGSTFMPSNTNYQGWTTPYSGGGNPIGGSYDPMMNTTRNPYAYR